MMVKAFEDIVFKQKEGEISGLVQSDFGYHIIKVTGIKPGHLRPLDEVRSEIVSELKTQAASRKFAEAAEVVHQYGLQSDSLQPAADKFKLKVEKSGLIGKNPDPQALAALGPLANPEDLSARCFRRTRSRTSATPKPSKSRPTRWSRRASSNTLRRPVLHSTRSRGTSRNCSRRRKLRR